MTDPITIYECPECGGVRPNGTIYGCPHCGGVSDAIPVRVFREEDVRGLYELAVRWGADNSSSFEDFPAPEEWKR